jgi:hypothetical protein
MSKNKKYPHLKELFNTDKKAYFNEWRKLNLEKFPIKDKWRKLDNFTYDELPTDVIPVPDFPTYYARPNGEVWRDTRGYGPAVKAGKERVLKLRSTYIPKNGYWLVQPYKDGKRKAIYLHRFILTAFKGPAPESGMHCHHIDHDTSNNSIENLMWVTVQENVNYSHHNMFRPKMKLEEGRQVSNSKHSHLHPKIIRLSKLGIRPVDIAAKLNVPKGSIYLVIKALERRGQL